MSHYSNHSQTSSASLYSIINRKDNELKILKSVQSRISALERENVSLRRTVQEWNEFYRSNTSTDTRRDRDRTEEDTPRINGRNYNDGRRDENDWHDQPARSHNDFNNYDRGEDRGDDSGEQRICNTDVCNTDD